MSILRFRATASFNIRIYDYDIGARWYDKESLEAVWRGTSLVLAQDTNFQSPSSVSTATYWVDQGDLDTDDDAEYSFIIKNVSSKPLELKIDSTSCQCSSATLDKNMLEPGQATILTATVKLENKRGGFRERVVLTSTCGEESRTDSFILAGTVVPYAYSNGRNPQLKMDAPFVIEPIDH